MRDFSYPCSGTWDSGRRSYVGKDSGTWGQTLRTPDQCVCNFDDNALGGLLFLSVSIVFRCIEHGGGAVCIRVDILFNGGNIFRHDAGGAGDLPL